MLSFYLQTNLLKLLYLYLDQKRIVYFQHKKRKDRIAQNLEEAASVDPSLRNANLAVEAQMCAPNTEQKFELDRVDTKHKDRLHIQKTS